MKGFWKCLILPAIVAFLVSSVVGSTATTPVPVPLRNVHATLPAASPSMAQYNALKDRIRNLEHGLTCLSGLLPVVTMTYADGTQALAPASPTDTDPSYLPVVTDRKCVQ